MNRDTLDELWARIGTLALIAETFAPSEEGQIARAAWSDVCELMGQWRETQVIPVAPGQLDLFEGVPV
jgi:hypothetical protein